MADCLTENAAAQFVDGRLAPAAQQLVEEHLGSCPACLAIVAAGVRLKRTRESLHPSEADEPTLPGQRPVVMPFRAGDILADQFRLESVLGVGGMGVVWRATDLELGRSVALKLLHSQLGADPAWQERFRREAQLLAAVEHPAIVPIHACPIVRDRDGTPIRSIVMPLLRGESLASRLRTRGRFALAAAIPLLLELLDALAAAHERGIIHRDIKPQNLMVVRRGDADALCVLDFGIATSPAAAGTSRLAPAGTPAYMAPEQILTPANVDGRADLWAAALCGFEMLTGQPPFAGDTLGERLGNIFCGRRRSLAEHGLPASLDAVFARLLDPDRDARPNNALRMRALLAGALPATVPPAHPSMPRGELGTYVGYDTERRRLHDAFTDATEGRGRAVFVVGESGIGKSSLLATFLDEISSTRDLRTATGRCRATTGAGEAYLPFLELVSRLASGPASTSARTLLRAHAPMWLLQLPTLCSSTQELDALRSETRDASPERMRNELCDFLCALANASTVVVALEDFHWADASSLTMLEHLIAKTSRSRMLVLVTTRADCALSPAASAAAATVALGGLSHSAVDIYLEQRFGMHQLSDDFRRALYDRSEGNPLVLQSMIELLARRGTLRQTREGTWLIPPTCDLDTEALGVIRAVTDAKLATLSSAARRLLECAGVVGEQFTTSLLAAALSEAETAVEQTLTEIGRLTRLVALDGEQHVGARGTLRWRFAHGRYHAIVYESVAPAERRRLHAAIAAALSSADLEDPHARAARLAAHLEAAGDVDRASQAFAEAAEAAARRLAYPEAEQHINRAIELARMVNDIPARILSLQLRRCGLLFDCSRFRDVIRDSGDLVDQARALGYPMLESAALRLQCVALYFNQQTEEFLERTSEAIAVAQRVSDVLGVAQSTIALGLGRATAGAIDEARRLYQQGLQIGRQLRDKELIGTAMVGLGTIDYFQSSYESAERALDEGAALLSNTRSGFMTTTARFFLSLTLGNLGRIDAALALLDKIRRSCERNEDHYWLARIPNSIGWLYAEVGAFDEARKHNQLSVQRARMQVAPEALVNGLVNLALIASAQGDHAAALAALAEVDGLCGREERMRWRYALRYQMALAQCALARGELELASRAAEAVLERAQGEQQARKYVVEVHRVRAEIAIQRAVIDEARTHLDAALAVAARITAPLSDWRLHATAVRVQVAGGNAQAAAVAHARLLQATDVIALQTSDAQLKQSFRDHVASVVGTR